MSIKTKAKQFWSDFLKNQAVIEKALDSQDSKEKQIWEDKFSNACMQIANCTLSLSKEEEFYVLTFEPHKDKTAQIICVYLKKFATQALVDKWMIFDCVPPLQENIFHYHFKYDEKDYTIDDLSVSIVEKGNAKDMFDVWVMCEAFESMNIHEAETLASTYVENILGDLLINCYVDKIEIQSKKTDGYKYVPLKEAYDEVIEMMDLHHYAMYSDCTQLYSVYKLDEAESDEVLKDRVLISTIQPLNFVEVMNQERHSLNAITRLGGEVGFLIYPIDSFDEKEAQKKRVLEKELNDLLYTLGIARIVGSGIAPKRIYLEVFIFDKEEFKKAIVKVVSKLNLPLTYLAY